MTLAVINANNHGISVKTVARITGLSRAKVRNAAAVLSGAGKVVSVKYGSGWFFYNLEHAPKWLKRDAIQEGA